MTSFFQEHKKRDKNREIMLNYDGDEYDDLNNEIEEYVDDEALEDFTDDDDKN